MSIIGKLICAVTGKHKRMRFVRVQGGVRVLVCPRCGAEKHLTKPMRGTPGDEV